MLCVVAAIVAVDFGVDVFWLQLFSSADFVEPDGRICFQLFLFGVPIFIN
jgi:hypothetical protein